MSESEKMETRSATIIKRKNGLVETRFKENALIDSEGIRENIEVRRRLCVDIPHALLTIVPPDARFATSTMTVDPFPEPKDRAQITAIALVAPVGVTGMMARLYFSCFPAVAVTRIFGHEEPAIRWLEERLLVKEG